jgi:hypothetical protein
MKINNYRANKKSVFLYLLFVILTVYLVLQFTDFKNYFKGEIETFQKYNRSFSSTNALYQDGSVTSFSNQSTDDYIDIATRVASIIGRGYEKPPGVLGNIELFIKFKNLQKIYADRKNAIMLGVNRASQEVPCKISDGVKILKCKIKLKGDLEDHWQYKSRLSLKVEVEGGYINGLKRFSIQKPRARQFPYDQIFHQMVAKMGNHSSNKQDFYSVFVNGESWGTMNVEPDVNQEFVEEAGLKRLGVFRISNQDIWSYGEKYNGLKGYYLSDPTINLTIKGANKILTESPAHLEVYSYIKRMLRAKDGELFNREMMAQNLTLSLVWGAFHTLYNSNSFYTWNVYQKQLEPILTDQVWWAYWNTTEGLLSNFQELPFEYRVLFRANPLTAKELETALSSIDNLLESNPALTMANELQKRYFPADRRFSKEPLTSNAKLIRDNIGLTIRHINSLAHSPVQERSTRTSAVEQLSSLEAFHTVDAFSDGRIRINNLTNLELKVTDIEPGVFDYVRSADISIPPSVAENISFIDFELGIPEKDLGKIVVQTEISGHVRQASVDRVLPAISSIEIVDRNIGCMLTHDKCFLPLSFKYTRTVSFDRPVVIRAGSSIQLKNGANLLFLSGLEALGNSQQKITFNGDGSGGIYVLNPLGNTSKMSYMTFEGLGAVQAPMYKLTGSVNGYGGKFLLNEVSFQSSEAEDQLNLVHTEVDIGRATFRGAKSDAFDCDFCLGDIQLLSFDDVGGDGLDLSGSRLTINQMKAANIGDKALSVGEKSTIAVDALWVNGVSTGVAVKDGSSASIEYMTSVMVRDDALMTYIKKPFYSGVTKLIVNKFVSKATIAGQLCARESGTDLYVNGRECQITDLSVDDLYQGRMKK